MKIAYLAPYRGGTGYSNSAIQHMLALDSVGIDVVARQVKMTPKSFNVPEKINSFENKDLKGVDVVIQHNLPSEFAYKGGVLNVGVFAYETNGFPHSDWKFGLNLMDKVFVSCNEQIKAIGNTCGNSVVDKTSVIPHPVDVSKFRASYEPMDFDTTKSTVKFYTIAEFNKRKNISALLVAYYTAFDCNDDVLLIIKTSFGNSEGIKRFRKFCDDLKTGLRRFKNLNYYPKVAILPEYLTDSQINSLHVTGDVFVTSSHAEAICLPFLDAAGFGNPSIGPKHSAFLDYTCPVDNDLLVDSYESIAFGVEGAPDGLYSCDERWGNISLPALSDKMRWCYQNIRDLKDPEQIELRKQYVESIFSYESVGQLLKEKLSAKES